MKYNYIRNFKQIKKNMAIKNVHMYLAHIEKLTFNLIFMHGLQLRVAFVFIDLLIHFRFKYSTTQRT